MSKRHHIAVRFSGVEIDIVLANDFDPLLPSVAEMKLFTRIAHLLVPAIADVDSSLCARELSAALILNDAGRSNTDGRRGTASRLRQRTAIRRKVAGDVVRNVARAANNRKATGEASHSPLPDTPNPKQR